MLPIERCRQILGSAALSMSDAQVERLRDQLYGIANAAVLLYLDQRTTQRSEAMTGRRK
jgi:hypothetical protein